MRKIFTLVSLILVLLLNANQASAQAEGDYQTLTSGDWNSNTTWERFTGGMWVPAPAPPSSVDGVITILNTHTVTVTTAVTADELVINTGGTLTLTGLDAFTLVNGAGTDLSNQGTLNVSNGTLWSGNIVNDGTINWSSGDINMSTATIDNNGTFNLTGNNLMDSVAAGNALNNSATGIISKNAGATQSNFEVPITNAGVINVNSGVFRIPTPGSLVNSGNINITNNSTFTMSFRPSIFNPGSTITGNGIFNNAGDATLNTGITIPAGIELQVNGQFTTGPGSLTIDGLVTWNGAAIRVPTTINAGATMNIVTAAAKILNNTLTNNGTVNWSGGIINFNNALFTNNNIFNINLAADNSFAAVGGTPQFTNSTSGDIYKTNPATTFTVTAIPVLNNGDIYAVGTINVTGTLTNNGWINPAANGIGQLTMNSSAVSPTSSLWFNILDATGPGTGNDRLTLTAATDVTGATLVVTEIGPVAFPNTFEIMSITGGGTFSGSFGSVVIPGGYVLNPYIGTTTVTVTKTRNIGLPVKWGDFTVKAVNKKVHLNWTTLEESNNSHFVIESSNNGINYTALATLKAKGNSTNTEAYSFVHNTPNLNGKNFYRIKQVDLDGRNTLSPYRLVSFKNVAIEKVMITPNPIKDKVLINVSSNDVRIVLSDGTGRVLSSITLKPGLHSIDMMSKQSGIYFFTIYEGNTRLETKSLIKN